MTSSPSSLSTLLWAYSPCSSSPPLSISLYVVLSPLRLNPEGTSSRFLTAGLFLGKRSEFLGAALLGTRWFCTRQGIRVNLGSVGGVGVANANARKCPEVLRRTGGRGIG